jgi:hypothetical protein
MFPVGLNMINTGQKSYNAILRCCVPSARLIDAAQYLRLEIANGSAPVCAHTRTDERVEVHATPASSLADSAAGSCRESTQSWRRSSFQIATRGDITRIADA